MIERERARFSEQELAHLWTRAQQSDQAAREEIFFLLRGRFLSVAKHRLMEEDAKDVVQETLIVVHQRFSELKTVDDLVAFTFGVLRNKIGNVYRKRERRKRYEAELEEVPEPVYCLDDQFEAAQLDRVIVQAIMKTKPGCQAILMGLHEGFSVGDLSHRFHIPRARMDKQVFHCRQALQRILLEDYRLQV